MRTHLLTAVLALAVAALVAVVVVHPPGSAPASSAHPTAFEFKLVRLQPGFGGNSEATLNQMGAQGWDIAYGVGEYILMKRSK